MKLHLPTRLRAAVLACFAVVTSFTTTLATGALAGGAFVVTATALVAPQAEGAAFDSITHGGDFWISDYRYSFILDDVGSNGTVVAAYWGSSATENNGANGLKVTDNGDGTYSVALDNCKLSDTNIDATTTLTSNRGTSFDGLVLKTGVVYTVTANGIVGGDNGAKATITDVVSGTATESGTYNSNMNGNQNPPFNKVNDAYAVNGSTALVWTGDMAAWKNTSGEVTALSADKVLYFDASESVSKTADVGGDVSVAGMKLYDNYTINATAAANIAAANGVTVVGDKTMTLSAAGSNTSTNTVSADFSGGLAVSSGTWALSGAVNARSLAVNGGALTLSGAVNLSGMNFAAADGDTVGVSAGAALTFADSAAINLGNLAADTAYKIFDLASGASLNGWDALTAENFFVNGAVLNSTVYEVTLTNGTFMYSMLVSDLTWNGGDSGVWDFTTACWTTGDSGSVFGNDVNVIFNNTASVEVQGAINAGKMTVTSGNTLTLSADETGSVSAKDLDIQGSLQNSVGIAVSGGVTMADTASWTLSSGAAQVLTEAQFANVKNMEIQNGASLALNSITTGQNGTVNASQLSGAGNVILKLRGDNGVNFNLSNFAGNIRVEKADGVTSARLQVNGSTFHANSTITLQTNGDLVFNGSGTVLSNDVSAEGVTKFFVNSGKSATINSDLSGAGTITKTAAGTLTLNGTVTVSEFISEEGTTNISGGSVTTLRTTGGTVNVNGGVVTSLKVRGGTTNLGDASGTHIWVGGGATVNVIGDYTASQLRMSEQNTSTVNIKGGGSLTITGSENGHNTNRSILLAHWGYNSTLHMEGGSLTATDAVLFPSWTGTGTFKATAGTATLKGISFYDQSYSAYSAKGQFLLGDASSGTARVNIGSEGISHVNGTSVVVNLGNGTLGATDDWAMRFENGQTSANVQLVGTAGGTVFDTMGHTVTVNTTLGGDGKLVKEGEGTLDLIGTVTSTGSVIAKGGMLNIKSAGPNSFSTMEVAEGGALTIETDAVANVENLKLAAPLTNKGTLTISGSLTVDLSGFTPETGSGAISYVDSAGNTSDNGYRTGNFTYKLIDNIGTLNDDAITSVIGSDGTYADGILTTTTPDYSNYWVNTTVDAETLPEGRKYYINGGTLNVGTDGDRILRTTAGTAGTMKLTSNAALRNNQSTLFEGKLTVESGATLTIGQVGANNQSVFNVNLTSLSALELNGGTIEAAYAAPTIPVLNVTAASLYKVDDIKSGSAATPINQLNLSADLTLQTNWKSNINVDLLTGSGDLTVRQTNGGENTVSPFSIAAIDNYTGKITVGAASEHSKVALSLNISNGQTFSAEKLEVAGTNASAVLLGSGTYNVGSTLALGDRVSLGSAWAGTVSAAGVTADGTLDASGLCSTASSALVINGLTVNAGAALTLGGSGNTELAGNVVLKESILAGSSNISFAAGASLDLTGLTAATDGEWKVLTLFTGADVDLNTLTSAMLTSATQALGSDWTFGSDGTVKYKEVADPSDPVRYYWEGNGQAYGDAHWSLTDDDTSAMVSLPTDTSNVILVYSNAGAEASPCVMTLAAAKTVAGIEVTGGYYRFTTTFNPLLTCTGNLVLGEGGHLSNSLRMAVGNVIMAANSSLSINSALTIAEGGKVTVTGAGAVINQGKGGQPQSLSTSALEITGNGSSLSIIGLKDSKSATTLGSVTLGDNTTLTLKAGATNIVATATALSLGNNAAIVLEANQVLDLTAIEDMDDEDTGKFSKLLNATSGAGTLKVSMPGEFRMKTDTAVNTNLEAAQLKINSYETGGKTLTVTENGSITLTGRLILQSTAKTLVAGGRVTADKIELGHQTSGNPGHIEMTGGSITTGGFVHYNAGNTVTMSGGTLDITSTTGISNGIKVTITGGTLVASNAGGWGMTSASVGGAAVSADSTGKVTMTNTTVTGNITGNDKLVLAGTVNATANAKVSGASVGGVTVTATDANKLTLNDTTIGSAITNNGALEFSGTQNVTLAGSSATKYADVYGSTTYGDNGYKSTLDAYTLVNGTAATAVADTSWQVNGVALSGTAAFDGNVLTHITEDAAGKVYYINSGRVEYTAGAGCAEAVQLQLTGGKLVMSQELDSTVTTGGIAVTGSSTTLELKTELAANKLSMGTGAGTVLMGDGTLNLGTDTALASGISLGTETDAQWTGTVKVTGAALTDANLGALGVSGSTIELDGTDGTLKDGTYAAAVKLTNGSDVSLGANNNFSTLDATDGNLSISGMGNSISTLTLADNATLGMNMADISLGSLTDLGTDALLTVGTLNAGTPGGPLTLAVNVSEDLLLTMSHGQSILLADIGICDADTAMGLMVGGQPAVTELEVTGSNGVSYLYALNKDNSTGHTYVTVAARMLQNGWIGDESDIWTTADTIDGIDSNWDNTVGLFCGYGSGTVNIDTAGVDASGKTVLVSAPENTTDYTFKGGALVANKLVVNAGSLTINNEGVETQETVMVSGQGSLTVNTGKTLTVGTDMAVLNEAEFTNKGETTVAGMLSVAKDAALTNSRNLSVEGISAEGATINSTGQLTIGATGGTIGALTGNGYLNNSGELTIKSDTDLQALTNAGTLAVEGVLNVTATATGGVIKAAAANLGYAKLAELQVTGAVTAKELTVDKATMQSLTADKLASLAGDTVTVTDHASLGTFSVNGVLDVGGHLTVAETVESEGEILAASADLQADATLDTLKVTGDLKATNLAVTNLEAATLNAESLTITGSGTGTVQSGVTLEKFSGSGSFTVQGDLTVNSSIAQGGTVQADNITVAGSAVFADVTTGSLTADAVSLTNGSITTLNTTNLTVHGTASVTDDVSLASLGGTGTLQVDNKLTLTEQITSSAHVAAGILELQATGSTLGSVLADTLTMAEGLTLSMSDALLTVDDFGTLNDSTVDISLSESIFASLDKEASGLYSIADYLIIDGVASADIFNLTDCTGLDALRAAGRDATLTVSKGKLYLSITAAMDENGEEIGLIWDATGGNTTTSTGSDIDTEEGFYKALDYVQQVLVKDDVTFDLSADAVGDSESGNASKPELGLTVRNLRGGGELTIKGNGTDQDVASLFNTDGKVTSDAEAVALTVDASRVNLGLPTGSKGIMDDDLGAESPTLASLSLVNGALVAVNADTEVLGDTDLADTSALQVAEGSILTTNMLSGTDKASVSGIIRVTKGGVYTGSGEGAEIIATGGSDLRLRTGGRKGMSLLAESGSKVTLDSAGQDGSLKSLRMGGASMARMARMAGAAELNLHNTTTTDKGIVHNTLSLTDTEGNYISNTAVTLSLGLAETARTLGTADAPVVIAGAADVTGSTITVNMLGNGVKNGALDIATDDLTDLKLAQLVTGGTVNGNSVVLTGTPEMQALMAKYYTNARLDKSGAITVDRVTDYYSSTPGLSENAQAGTAMADMALLLVNPQANRSEYKNLAGVLDSLDDAVVSGNSAAVDSLGAAVSGASVAALGAAVAGDVERQLMAIRNRTTTMGVDQTGPNLEMPYFNAWINAEGDFRRMDEDGTAAGYELNSWGGTVGFDVDISPNFTAGLAATAMYGDFTAKSADHAEGDMDTYYLTTFARFAAHRWSHTFVATVGMADTSLKRTVAHANGSYSSEGDTDALSFGFLYEVGYIAAMNESATACLQPVFNVMLSHSSLNGYEETGSDAALTTGDVEMTTVTFGLGARTQAQVGTGTLNRASLLEGRALVKLRAGDREAEAENALGMIPGASGSVVGAEKSVIGMELGVGLTVPVGSEGGSVFADASLELGGGYTNINGTVGYRINF